MGQQLVVMFLSTSAASPLPPNYWLAALAALPTLLLALIWVIVLVMAATDLRLPRRVRILWVLMIVVIPPVGTIAFAVVRGRRWLESPRRSGRIQQPM
ncbi:hypothetical protein [Sinomonas humi]|uniref:Cardiolipin synthase N-terminal domain-containing protein n=1 Tax=Sinomonas humi TaxID=1338436 RepID=A0A0B2ADC6_9MICC|nr:hypothetical protein [Sinomonas humi]KHL01594.1 hypothetical protein LK10_15200 [Sinomonas humi]